MSEPKKDKPQKKKIICIIIAVIIVIAIIIGIIWYAFSKGKSEENTTFGVDKLYESLQSKGTYSVTMTADDNNKMHYEKTEDKAYIDTFYDDSESKFIVKDGNAYLLIDEDKEYYKYENNDTDLTMIESELEELKEIEHENGKEKIKNKTYSYEEYDSITTFCMMDTSDLEEDQEVKTRFYFDGDKLVYIKTIIGDKQELLKVDISDKVDNNLFEIPSDYKEEV